MKAKTLLLIAMVLLVAAGTAFAGPGKFGVKAGIVLSDATYEYDPDPGFGFDPDSRTGLSLALFYEYPLISRLSIRPGIEYVQKGSQISVLRTAEDGSPLETREIKDRITYISIPVLGSVAIPVGKSKTNVLFGPRLDFKVSSDAELLIEDDFKSTVFGLTFGVGQELPLRGPAAVFIELNYHHDLSNAYEKGILTVKNKSFSIMGGFKF